MGAIFGQCPLCPKNSPTVRLYGGHCSYHFNHPQDDQSKTKLMSDVKDQHEKRELKKFFDSMVKIMPLHCENCGKRIIFTAAGKKAHVCHIVPKRHFKSVQTHPENRWFGCIDCHTDYDNKGWSFAVTMEVWPVCVERFRRFMSLIKDTELKYLPDPLQVVLSSTG